VQQWSNDPGLPRDLNTPSRTRVPYTTLWKVQESARSITTNDLDLLRHRDTISPVAEPRWVLCMDVPPLIFDF
jgi:hypothetical protein